MTQIAILPTTKPKQYTPDQFARFIFNQAKQIKSYTFDLMLDITSIVKYALDIKNYSNDWGYPITDKLVQESYILFIREGGTYLFNESAEIELINKRLEQTYDYIKVWRIVITPNHTYFKDASFAQVTKIK